MSKIYLGTTVEIECEVQSTKTGEAIDVDPKLLRIRRPSGELDEPTLTREETGKYVGTYDPVEKDRHKLVFIGKGAVKVTGPATFQVHDPGVSIE